MRVTVDREEFIKTCSRYITRGQRRTKTPIKNQITKSMVEAKDSRLHFYGCDNSLVIYGYFSLDAVIESEGSFMIAETDSLVKNIKKFRGKKLTIESDENTITYRSGQTSMTDPIQAIIPREELKYWIDVYYREHSNVHMTVNSQRADFTKWFTIKGSLLKDIESICLGTVANDVLHLKTSNDNLTLICENNNTRRRYETSFPVKDSVDAEFSIEYIYPILSALNGNSTFYFYVTKSGRLRVIIEDGNNWWYCRYDKSTTS